MLNSNIFSRSKDGGTALRARDSSDCCNKDTTSPLDPLGMPMLNSNIFSRSKDGGTALSARDSQDDYSGGNSENYMPQSGSDIPKQPITRDSFEDFMTAITNVNARGSDIEQEAHAHGSLDKAFGAVKRSVPGDFTPEPVSNPITEDELLSAASTMLSDRDFNSGKDIQARSFLSNVMKAIEGGFLRRDVTHDQLLAARDGREDFLDAVLSDRDFSSSGQEIQARGFWSDAFNIGMTVLPSILPDLLFVRRDGGEDVVNSAVRSRDSNPEQQARTGNGFAEVLNALASSRRDVTSDGLGARADWEDFVKMLNTRKLGFKRDMQVRGLFTGLLS